MADKFCDELAKWVKQRERPRKDKQLVSFLAVIEDIKEALDRGYTKKTIWEHLNDTGKLSYRYETFLKHVKQHITAIQAEEPQAGQQPSTEHQKKEPIFHKESSTNGFEFRGQPDKRELV